MSKGNLNGRKVKFYNAKQKQMEGTIVKMFVGSSQMVLYFLLLLEDGTFIQKLPDACTLLPEEPNPMYAKFGLVDPATRPEATPMPSSMKSESADLRTFTHDIH
jgi:hypothetical protein